MVDSEDITRLSPLEALKRIDEDITKKLGMISDDAGPFMIYPLDFVPQDVLSLIRNELVRYALMGFSVNESYHPDDGHYLEFVRGG